MAIIGKVGRSTDKKVHCENYETDQNTVIALLNRIPASEGGAEGSLLQQPTMGKASDSLFSAIMAFQSKNFPASAIGYFAPNDDAFKLLESLAGRFWENLTSKSVRKSLRQAFADDQKISHEEAVNLIRAMLSDGFVSQKEVSDIDVISANSKSMGAWPREMLQLFVWEMRWALRKNQPFRLTTDAQKYAAEMACEFLIRGGTTYFPKLHRNNVGIGLLMRIANPGYIDQRSSSLCGPAALLFNIAKNSPVQYARFAIDLFEKGKAKLGRLTIEPGSDVRSYKPPLDHIDWMTLASIRDSENWLLDYDTAGKEIAGATLPGELAHWFRKSGYRDVVEETNLVFEKGTGAIDKANEYFRKEYSVCLFIKFNPLKQEDQFEEGGLFEKHWVVMRSPIDRSNGKIRAKVFTWGTGEWEIPQVTNKGSKDLPVEKFLKNLYGFVAGKPF